MSDKVTDVMIAGYMTKEPALLDYEAVLKSGAKFEGVVCVSRDLEGNTSIEETDHLKKGGAKTLGAVGFVVGLFAPPLLLSTAPRRSRRRRGGTSRAQQGQEQDRSAGR